MARIVYGHPGAGGSRWHLFTNLDFWDARRILLDLAEVRRNFGDEPPGHSYPTRVIARRGSDLRSIEHRLRKAVASPPRHVVVEEVLHGGCFEFDPLDYYPARWSPSRMLRFSSFRLPVHQPPLETPHHEVKLTWSHRRIRAERVRRTRKHDPPIVSREEARRRRFVSSCF